MPGGEVGHPYGSVQGFQVQVPIAVLGALAVEYPGCVRLALEYPAEPAALDFGHVPDQAVQREFRRADRTALTGLVVQSLAFEEQGAVELEPRLEHVPLAKGVGRLLPAGVIEISDHGDLLQAGQRTAGARR